MESSLCRNTDEYLSSVGIDFVTGMPVLPVNKSDYVINLPEYFLYVVIPGNLLSGPSYTLNDCDFNVSGFRGILIQWFLPSKNLPHFGVRVGDFAL